MIKKLLKTYKTQLVIALTIFIVILAMGVVRPWDRILMTFLGSFIGAFVLDLEYIIFAYILEPTKSFSVNLTEYIKRKDYKNALDFLTSHKSDLKDKSLNSAVFQIVLALMAIFIVNATYSFFVKAVTLSVFANSIYKLFEHYYSDELDEWFWALKKVPTKKQTLIFAAVLILDLIYCLSRV